MRTLPILVKRNVKLYFKDKAMFFSSLITPAILLLLFVTFLGGVFKNTFTSAVSHFPEATIEDRLLNGLVAGQLVSSLLSVICVTLAFSSSFVSVADKASGAIKDCNISPIKPHLLSLGYFISNLVSTLIICVVATALCFIYMAIAGWYMSVGDVFLLIIDMSALVLFGAAAASVVNFFLSSQGQIAAVGTIVSSAYGFISGAYMPLASFSKGLRNTLMFMPQLYPTALLKSHCMQGALSELEKSTSAETIKTIKDSIDCNVYFFDKQVNPLATYLIISITIVVLLAVYVLLNMLKAKNIRLFKRKKQ